MAQKIKQADLPESFQDIVETIGLEATLKLVDLCGGQSLYVPKKESCELQARKRTIYEEWVSGKSTSLQLARKYNYTESHVRTIIREERSKRFSTPPQLEFFS